MHDDPLAWLADDPELREADARARMAARAEAAAWEALAARDRLRGRRLADVAREACLRGDTVALTVGDRSFTGTVVHAAADLVRIAVPAGIVDVNLRATLAIAVTEHARRGGHEPAHGPRSFTARLFEHEATWHTVEIGGSLPGGGLVGRIDAVASDHVVLVERTGTTWHVAHQAVGYVAPPA